MAATIGVLSDGAGLGVIDINFQSWAWPGRPEPEIVGAYKVVVANPAVDLSKIPKSEWKAATKFAGELRKDLSQQVEAEAGKSGGLLGVGSPRETDPQTVTDEPSRADELDKERKGQGGDVAISVTFKPEDHQSKLRIDLAFGGSQSGEATELVGYVPSMDLDAGDWSDRAVGKAKILGDAAVRASSYARLLVAISKYETGDLTGAASLFEEALNEVGIDKENIPVSSESIVREFVYLMLGNTFGRQAIRSDRGSPSWVKYLGKAKIAYKKALLLNNNYARARLGLAEILYQESYGKSCAVLSGKAALNLSNSRDAYLRVLNDASSSPIPDVDVKGRFGIGRVDACLFIGGKTGWADEVISQMSFVTHAYESNHAKVWIKGLASEAYADMGLVEWSRASNESARNSALANYAHAIDLAVDSDRQKQLVHYRQCLVEADEGGVTKPACS